MTDWRKLGEARGIPPEDLDRVASVLESLEAAFRPLAQQIPPSAEPPLILSHFPQIEFSPQIRHR
jgi:hypothetical protein